MVIWFDYLLKFGFGIASGLWQLAASKEFNLFDLLHNRKLSLNNSHFELHFFAYEEKRLPQIHFFLKILFVTSLDWQWQWCAVKKSFGYLAYSLSRTNVHQTTFCALLHLNWLSVYSEYLVLGNTYTVHTLTITTPTILWYKLHIAWSSQ